MPEPPPYPHTGDHTPDSDAGGRTPRWVYLLWALGILVVVVFVTLHLTGVMGPGAH